MKDAPRVRNRGAVTRRTGLRIGISGWTYPPWRGIFYPPGLVHREELPFASRQVSSIEINGTFYSLQRPASYASWYQQTPADFVFAVKAPRFITHIRRLHEAARPLANFFASGVLHLEEKLGPILWQLPPSLPYDPVQLETFLAQLPRDTGAAVALARRHDSFLKATWFKPKSSRPLRHALEVRNQSFCDPSFIALLRRHEVAVVVADTAGKWPLLEDLTAGFVYVRLHGDAELYVSGYTDAALASWADKIRIWRTGRNPPNARIQGPVRPTLARGREVFVYFDNDVKAHAPHDAMALAHRLGAGPPPPDPATTVSIVETPRTRWPGRSPSSAVGPTTTPRRKPKTAVRRDGKRPAR